MDEHLTGSTLHSMDDLQILQRRMKYLSIAFAVFATVSTLCWLVLACWSWQQSRTSNMMMEDILFGQFVHYEAEGDDYVKPVVSDIQFFHDGYSMQFDTVEYTPKGLFLSGEIGNPNQYRVKNLTLNFVARPQAAKVRQKWDKSDKNFVVWPPEWDIGSAQINIGDLEAGHAGKFRVTIPNVKDKSDPIRIAVLFSGERYVYSSGH
jgi:hypothetical protein